MISGDVTWDGSEPFITTGGCSPKVEAQIRCLNRRMSESGYKTVLFVEDLPPNYVLCKFCGGSQFVFPENGSTDKETPVMCVNCDSLFALGIL